MKKYAVTFVLIIMAALLSSGCFSEHEYVADYQIPDTFIYSITGTTNGIGDRSITFTNSIRNDLRGVITDSGIYSASTMRVKIYNYDTNTVGLPVANIVPLMTEGKIVCNTTESEEAALKSCKQALIQVEATRGNNTIVILEGVVYNGYSRAGTVHVNLDFFTYTKSLIYRAWQRLHPASDYADFIYNLVKSDTYIDLAVVGVKEAIADWNNFDYLNLDYDLAIPSNIAVNMSSEKCYNLYCLKIPGLEEGGTFSGIRCEDIYVQAIGLDGKVIQEKTLAPDGSFTFSLPSKNTVFYGIKVISGLTEKWLATDLIGSSKILNADLQLFAEDFLVR